MPLQKSSGYRLDCAYQLRGETTQQFPVQSRIIKGFVFTQEDGQLRIWFKYGEVRDFIEVRESKVDAVCDAVSPDQHYVDRIRKQLQCSAT